MRSTILLFLGAALGIVLAASGLLQDDNVLSLASESVAEVNGVTISQQQFQSIASGIAAEKKSVLKSSDYEFVLQKLIDEELLVQRGSELGLLELNSVIRNNIVQAVMASIIAENAFQQANSRQLETFYAENRDFFTPPMQLRFRQLKFSSKDQAQLAYKQLLAGGDYYQIKDTLAEETILSIPNKMLPLSAVRKYIGPSMLEKVKRLDSQAYSEPVAHQDAWFIFYIEDKKLGEPPALESIEVVVRNEYKRRSDEQAVREYVLWLRKRADISRLSVSGLEGLAGKKQQGNP